MYNLLIALGIGAATYVVFSFALGAGSFEWAYGLVPGMIALGIAYALLARRSFRQVQDVNARAQEALQKQNFDEGIKIMKEAMPLAKWQFLVEPIIHAQIGMVYFMTKKFKKAEPHLRKGFKRNWIARAMLAVHLYNNKKYDEMKKTFEEALRYSKKESLLWNVYAYCMWKRGKRDEAIAILNRALETVPGDERTSNNLNALRNNKKMKMRGWNMQWYQFHLERPPVQRQRDVRFKRRRR